MQDALNLEYIRADQAQSRLESHKGHVLGLVAFGANAGKLRPGMQPEPLCVNVPVLGAGDVSLEVWTSGKQVTSCGLGNIKARTDGTLLFGSLELEQAEGMALATLSRQAYLEIFAFIDRMRCPHLLRVWNYVPRINEPEDGLERYRCFNLGRHEAFVASGRDISEETVPAASVVGCGPGPMVIYFLAATQPGKPVDNPRQLTAYRYPEQYGPRSPIFVRAMLARFGTQQCLIVSGTASIVGHETMHKGNAEQQALETVRNIRTLMEQAYPSSSSDSDGPAAGRTLLKVYVRHAQDLARVREHIERVFGPDQQTVYLLSDICRADLLLEIEGIHFGDTRP